MSVEIKEITFENFGKCVLVSNGIVEAYVTIDLGPRVIYFGCVGGPNVFFTDPERKCGLQSESLDAYYGEGSRFYNYGGHRLWISPQREPETYYPDNDPVVYALLPDGVRFTPPRQRGNDLQFSIELMMNASGNDMMVVHSVQNVSKEDKVFALWGITCMAQGGTLIVPQSQTDAGSIPNRVFTLWPGIRMNDPRFYAGDKYYSLIQDPADNAHFKFGSNNHAGWSAYINKGYTFITRQVHEKDAIYPDCGSSFEAYADENFLEVETLSPLYNVEPKETVRHVENWSVLPCGLAPSSRKEEEIDAFVKQYL